MNKKMIILIGVAALTLSAVVTVGPSEIYAQEDCGQPEDAEDITRTTGWTVQYCDDGQQLLTGPDGQQSWIGSQEYTITDRENPEDRIHVSSC